MNRERASFPALPHNLDAERAILGAVILDNNVLASALKHISSGDFFDTRHQKIFRCMIAMNEAGKPADLVTLTEEMHAPGELEAAGGPPYVASLVDGMPHVSNVEHYAHVVKEKAILRSLACTGEAMTRAALDGDWGRARDYARTAIEITPAPNGLRVVTAHELLKIELTPREMVLDPILPAQGLAMIYSKRGVGKTYLGLEIADAVSCGRACLRWQAPKPRRVLYIDGELPANVLQSRLVSVITGAQLPSGIERKPDMLRFITPDLQTRGMPDVATRAGQETVERELKGVEFLILDSISTLCRTGQENEGDDWLGIQDWILLLRRQGLSVLLNHHAGKSGAQRGTSRREDVLDTVIALRHPSDYSPREGLRFEIHFEKLRSHIGDEAKAFEAKLQLTKDGAATWTMRDVEDALRSRAEELFEDGLTIRDIAEALSVPKSTVGRWRKQWQSKNPTGGGE